MVPCIIRPVQKGDAEALFPMIYHSPVTDTLQWDGPTSANEYIQGLEKCAEAFLRGENHRYTILGDDPPKPVGQIDIRPDEDLFRGDIGLWIGQEFHGRGLGSQAVRWMLAYGFGRLGMQKIEANIFAGNEASRRIFDKNGFILEGFIRKAAVKRGLAVDEWLVGITREDYFYDGKTVEWIVHICPLQDWRVAQETGQYCPASLAQEGFIHTSRPSQVIEVANAFYRAETDLALLWIDPLLALSDLRWDAVDEKVFPHLYGPLNLEAVAVVQPFPPGEEGIFTDLPGL